jgi:O-antigen ligase
VITALLLLCLVVVISWFRPIVGLAVAMQGYLIRGAVFPDPTDDTGAAVAAFLPVSVFTPVLVRALLSPGHTRYVFNLFDVVLVSIGLLLLLGALYSHDLVAGAELAARYWLLGIAYYFAAMIVLSQAPDGNEIRQFFLTTWAISVLLSAIAIAGYEESGSYRLTVGSASAIPFGLLVATGLLVNLHWVMVLEKRPVLRAVLVGSFVLLGYALVANQTRGVVLALVISGSLLVCTFWARGARILTLPQSALAGMLLGLLWLYGPLSGLSGDLIDSLRGVLSEQKSLSVLQRLSGYKAALELFAEHPFFGIGTASFAAHHFLIYPHNILLELLVAHGIPGFFAFLVLTVAIFYYSYRVLSFGAQREEGELAVIVVAILALVFVEAQFSFALWMHKSLFVMLAFLVALERIGIRRAVSGQGAR